MDVDIKKDLVEVEKTRKVPTSTDLAVISKVAKKADTVDVKTPAKVFKEFSSGLDKANSMLMKAKTPIENVLSEYIPPLANPAIREGVNNVLEYSKEHNLVHWMANTTKRQRREDMGKWPGQIVNFIDRGLDRLESEFDRMEKRQRKGDDRRTISHDGFGPLLLQDYSTFNGPIEIID